MEGRFQYIFYISNNWHKLQTSDSLPTYLGVGATTSKTNEVAVPSDPSSRSHQTTLAPQDEVGEVVNPPIELSLSPPTSPTLYVCTNLDCNLDGCHVVSSTQPPSTASFDPPDFGVLCSSVLESTCDVHKDQVLDEAGVGKPTYTIIFDEYVGV